MADDHIPRAQDVDRALEVLVWIDRWLKDNPCGNNPSELMRVDFSTMTLLIPAVTTMREALHEIVDPLGALKKRAAADGKKVSGMAYQIVNAPDYLKDVARKALGEGR